MSIHIWFILIFVISPHLLCLYLYYLHKPVAGSLVGYPLVPFICNIYCLYIRFKYILTLSTHQRLSYTPWNSRKPLNLSIFKVQETKDTIKPALYPSKPPDDGGRRCWCYWRGRQRDVRPLGYYTDNWMGSVRKYIYWERISHYTVWISIILTSNHRRYHVVGKITQESFTMSHKGLE